MKKIVVSEPVMIYDDPHMPFIFDSTLCTLRQPNGRIRTWQTDLGTKPYYLLFEGPPSNPLEKRVGTFAWNYNGYSDRWPDGLWVQSFYQVKPADYDCPASQKGDLLIGFVHREQFSNPFKEDGSLSHSHSEINSYHIGLAISEDAGMNWFYVGDVAGNAMNDRKDLANMGGVPFFAVGEDFQFFFNEYPFGEPDKENPNYVRITQKYLSAARCNKKETIEALLRHELPEVKKYSGNGVFDTEPMFGTGAPILPGDKMTFDAHADAAYCSALGQYLLLSYGENPARLCLFSSPDGVRFDNGITLYTDDTPGFCTPYSTFVGISGDDSSDDFSTVGRAFYVFFARKMPHIDYQFDEWFRIKITVEEA